MTRASAVIAVLTQTAPLSGLDAIGYRYTHPRDPMRNRDVIKRDLARAHVEWRMQDHADDSAVVSVRRQKGASTVIRLEGWRRA